VADEHHNCCAVDPHRRRLSSLAPFDPVQGTQPAAIGLRQGQPDIDVAVDIAKYPSIFSGDMEENLAAVLAVGQCPLGGKAFTELASAAAWKTKISQRIWRVCGDAECTANAAMTFLAFS
jgi:hypothetical protein